MQIQFSTKLTRIKKLSMVKTDLQMQKKLTNTGGEIERIDGEEIL